MRERGLRTGEAASSLCFSSFAFAVSIAMRQGFGRCWPFLLAHAGRVTVAVVPRPDVLSNRSVPPCCSMMPRAMVIPRPEPPSFVV